MKTQLSLIFLTLVWSIGFSQVNGNCIDENGNGIPYVNITVKNKVIGTVSNENGKFSLDNETLTENDTLLFSHINFEPKTISFSRNVEKIIMYSKVQDLEEVIVSNNRKKKIKEKIIGTKTESGNVVLKFVSKNLGTEVGKIIQVKKNNVYDLKKMFFNVADFGYKSATFRINFYSINEGIAGVSKINYKENIVEINKVGLVEIDLSNQNLSFESDFLISIEWIAFVDDNGIALKDKIINLSSTVFSGPFANRYNVNLPWKIDKVQFNAGIGIYLLVDNYKYKN